MVQSGGGHERDARAYIDLEPVLPIAP